MYRYYGEGMGDSGGYCASLMFSVIPSSCELIVYDTRARQTYYLENDSYVVGDSSSGHLALACAPRRARQRGVDLRIRMARIPGSAAHVLAQEHLWADFQISREPAFANVRRREDSLRILLSIKSGEEEEEEGRWVRSCSPPPGNPDVLRLERPRIHRGAAHIIYRAPGDAPALSHGAANPSRPPGSQAPSTTSRFPEIRPDS